MITGKVLKKMREEAGLTQEELARLAGVSQAHIAKIENEKVNPRLSTINKILSVLRVNRKHKFKNLMTKQIISVQPNDSIELAVKLMRKYNISQLPVIERGGCVGSISEKTIVRNLDRITKGSKVEDIMEEPFPIVSANESLEVIRSLLDYHQAVLISEKGKLVGIVTKSDFLNLLE